jgi:hypothetical protein
LIQAVSTPPTWIDPKIKLLFNQYLGPNRLADHDDPKTWEAIADIVIETYGRFIMG